jgi:hypothetical protein
MMVFSGSVISAIGPLSGFLDGATVMAAIGQGKGKPS